MIITCISGGVLPDFNKCIPYGEDNIAMYIGENMYFIFYDIYDCKERSTFSMTSFLEVDKDCHMTKEEIDYKLSFFRKHHKASVNRSLINPEESIFFDSIQVEVLSKFFFESKFSCKVDLVIGERRIELDELEPDSDLYNRVMSFVEEYRMCELISSKELAEIRAGIYKRKPSIRSIIAASVATGILGAVAGVAVGYKFSSKKQTDKEELPSAYDYGQQGEE